MVLRIIFFSIFYCMVSPAIGQKYLQVKIKAGDNLYRLMKRYDLSGYNCNQTAFKKINKLKNDNLVKDKYYHLPIKIYKYNDRSIRTTIGIKDYDQAKHIQDYNETLVKAKIKKGDYRTDKVLWVPHHAVSCGKVPTSPSTARPIRSLSTKVILAPKPSKRLYPIFGVDYQKVPLDNQTLKGKVYYIVSGHGGPDPGAINKQKNRRLCEDEYAYDISLRLARNLLAKGATVYIIVRDPNDGIRDASYLPPDKDEMTYGSLKMPYDSKKRLFQRSDAVNRLYFENIKKGIKPHNQMTVMLHIDSRSVEKRMDIFFYYFPGSKRGKSAATTIRNSIRAEYQRHQKGRGYTGTVKSRDLHMLRETKPMSIYIELGNIKNSADQVRFVLTSNRKALANWLAKGISKVK